MFKATTILIFTGTLLQTIIILLWGADSGFTFLGFHWSVLDICLVLGTYLSLIAFPLESKTLNRENLPPKFSSMKRIVILFLPFLGWGAYLGIGRQYYAFSAYFAGIAWVLILPVLAYLAQLSRYEAERLLQALLNVCLIIAALSIPFLLANRVSGTQIPLTLDYYGNSVIALVAVGFLIEFARLLVFGKLSPLDSLRFVLFVAMLLLAFRKKIILPTVAASSLMIVMTLVTVEKHTATAARSALVRGSLVLIAGLSFLLLVTSTTEVPDELANSYANDFQYKYLHASRDHGYDPLGGRTEIWNTAFEMIKSNPLGYGIGVRIAQDSVLKPSVSTHNTFIHIFLALGIPGGLVFLGVVYQLLKLLYRALRTSRKADLAIRLFLVSYAIWFLVLSFGDMFTVMPVAYVLFGLFLGFLLRFLASDQLENVVGRSFAAPSTILNAGKQQYSPIVRKGAPKIY